jgi:hypothetical protein
LKAVSAIHVAAGCRIGHIYSDVALAIKATRAGEKSPKVLHSLTIDDGVRGPAFVDAAAVKSSKADHKWVKM